MHLAGPLASDSSSSASPGAGDVSTTTTTKASTKVVQRSVGIVPPRREIEMIRRYYRNEAGIVHRLTTNIPMYEYMSA